MDPASDRSALNDEPARNLRRSLITLAILVVLVVALLLAVPGLDDVTNQLRHAQWGWIVAAVALELLSGLGYVLTQPRA